MLSKFTATGDVHFLLTMWDVILNVDSNDKMGGLTTKEVSKKKKRKKKKIDIKMGIEKKNTCEVGNQFWDRRFQTLKFWFETKRIFEQKKKCAFKWVFV